MATAAHSGMRDWCGDTRWRRPCCDPAGTGAEEEEKGVLLEVEIFSRKLLWRRWDLAELWKQNRNFRVEKKILAWEMSLIQHLEARKSKARSENGHPSRETGTAFCLKAGNKV